MKVFRKDDRKDDKDEDKREAAEEPPIDRISAIEMENDDNYTSVDGAVKDVMDLVKGEKGAITSRDMNSFKTVGVSEEFDKNGLHPIYQFSKERMDELNKYLAKVCVASVEFVYKTAYEAVTEALEATVENNPFQDIEDVSEDMREEMLSDIKERLFPVLANKMFGTDDVEKLLNMKRRLYVKISESYGVEEIVNNEDLFVNEKYYCLVRYSAVMEWTQTKEKVSSVIENMTASIGEAARAMEKITLLTTDLSDVTLQSGSYGDRMGNNHEERRM